MNITTDDPAIGLIRRLAADGNSSTYIAKALTSTGLRANRGNATWAPSSVDRLAKAAGITIRWRPGCSVLRRFVTLTPAESKGRKSP